MRKSMKPNESMLDIKFADNEFLSIPLLSLYRSSVLIGRYVRVYPYLASLCATLF